MAIFSTAASPLLPTNSTDRYSGWRDISSQLPYLNTFTCTFNYVFLLLNYIFSKNKINKVGWTGKGGESVKSWGLCVNIIKTGMKLKTSKELTNIPDLSNRKTTRLKIWHKFLTSTSLKAHRSQISKGDMFCMRLWGNSNKKKQWATTTYLMEWFKSTSTIPSADNTRNKNPHLLWEWKNFIVTFESNFLQTKTYSCNKTQQS